MCVFLLLLLSSILLYSSLQCLALSLSLFFCVSLIFYIIRKHQFFFCPCSFVSLYLLVFLSVDVYIRHTCQLIFSVAVNVRCGCMHIMYICEFSHRANKLSKWKRIWQCVTWTYVDANLWAKIDMKSNSKPCKWRETTKLYHFKWFYVEQSHM